MGMKKPTKKPADLNQLAKSIVDGATKDDSDKKKRPDLNKTATKIFEKATHKS